MRKVAIAAQRKHIGLQLWPAAADAADKMCFLIITNHAMSAQCFPALWGRAVAAEQRACVMLPGTVYNFDPHNSPYIKEQAAQQPKTRKGKIRVTMEQRLQQFADAGGKAIVVRAGDYFGPGAGNSWFAQGLIKPGKPVRKIYNPARPGIGHQWGYLPDVAATMVQVLEQRQRLDNFTNLHMAGHWDADGRQMVTMIQQFTQQQGSAAPIVSFPWWLISLMAPFNLTLREMLEMRYLWQQPLRLDNTRLIEMLGAEPHTPLEQAVNDTLNGLGCGI